MTSEEKRQEKLLLLLLALATDTERRVFIPQRRRIMMIMRKLRRIVQRMSPTGSFRTYEWARLKPLVLPLLNELSWSLRNQLLRELQPLIPEVQDAAADFMNPLETDMPVLVPLQPEALRRPGQESAGHDHAGCHHPRDSRSSGEGDPVQRQTHHCPELRQLRKSSCEQSKKYGCRCRMVCSIK